MSDAASSGAGPAVASGTSVSNGTGTSSSTAANPSKKRKAAAKKKTRKKGKKDHCPYRFSCSIKEDHCKPLFSVQFNPFYERMKDPRTLFATAGSNRVTIYECLADGSVKALQAYVDPEPEEVHYTCAWSYEPVTLDPLLAVAGRQGIIRILRPSQFKHDKSLIGHGQAINELKFHPKDPNLLLSISADHSIRFWNIKTQICVVIFGGEKGHRDEVLSADFNIEATKIISCGMDHSLKIWDMDKPEIKKAIKDSYTYDRGKMKSFKIYIDHFPIFQTCAVHRNYVDCARWLGNMVLSKSTDNQIVCWKPGGEPRMDLDEKRTQYLGDTVTVLHRHEYTGCEIWYVRFCIDPKFHVLAVGNQDGRVFGWDLRSRSVASTTNRFVLKHQKCITTVRQVGMNNDGSIIVCVCDDGTLWRWNRPRKEEEEEEAF